MSEFIFFMVGLLLGGCVSTVLLCCLQINHLHKNNSIRKETKDEKEKC